MSQFKTKQRLKTEHYSFRLNPNIPRERAAIDILNRYLDPAREIGVREVVASALYALDGQPIPSFDEASGELQNVIYEFRSQIDEIAAILAEARDFYASNPQIDTPELEEREIGIREKLLKNINRSIGSPKEYGE